MAIGRPLAFSTARTAAISLPWLSWLPWLMFTRKASAPAACSLLIISSEADAGPNVASTLTRRPLG
jgi:hypothetical protein